MKQPKDVKPIRAGRLQAIAQELGEPIETLVPRMVQQTGSVARAAYALDVSPNSILYWLKKLGYEPHQSSSVIWVKKA